MRFIDEQCDAKFAHLEHWNYERWLKIIHCPGLTQEQVDKVDAELKARRDYLYELNRKQAHRIVLHNWPRENPNRVAIGSEIFPPPHKHFYRLSLPTEFHLFFICEGCKSLQIRDRKWMYFQMTEKNYRPRDYIYYKAP